MGTGLGTGTAEVEGRGVDDLGVRVRALERAVARFQESLDKVESLLDTAMSSETDEDLGSVQQSNRYVWLSDPEKPEKRARLSYDSSAGDLRLEEE